MLATLACCSILTLGQGNALANGSFEEKGSKHDPVPSWVLSIGARNGGNEPISEVELDRKVRHSGKGSLRFSASRKTFAFQIAAQEIEARPGGTYRVSGFARTKNVRHEVNSKGITQFNNCYLAIFLFDDNGEIVARDIATPTRPYTDDWESLSLEVVAPDTVRRAEVKMFMSISGELWFDDLSVSIDGGRPIPSPAPVFRDDFEELTRLPPTWLVEEGARNGGEAPPSMIEVDRRKGFGKSKRSLHVAGSEETLLWQSANRYFAATPGDTFQLSAAVCAEQVRAEENVLGIQQFSNFHLRIVFLDDGGQTLGAARFANPGFGSYDWKQVSVSGVAPEGATRGLVGVFLSVSGDAWVDDIELTRQPGGVPAYAGWQSLETENLIIRFPPDHPRAEDLKSYGAELEVALAHIAKVLRVQVDEPIRVFLYRDKVQGEALTGRPLAFAEPERRAVHQDATNTRGHELAHVVALQLGYAQSGLFGEGLAVWLDGTPTEVHHERAAALLASGDLPAMADLLSDFRGQAAGYPAAGSFCGWFLEVHGLEDLRALYPRKDLDSAATAAVGQDMAELETAWHAFLRQD